MSTAQKVEQKVLDAIPGAAFIGCWVVIICVIASAIALTVGLWRWCLS